ncbi:MAG: hypothetical protein IBJ09_07280 [Bacteroidia bacterium]|nr:hypothetical protein [Bacteroidia bacterium]
MGIWDKFFKKDDKPVTPEQEPKQTEQKPEIPVSQGRRTSAEPVNVSPPQESIRRLFGRYTDANKLPQQLDAWTASVEAHKQKDYPEALEKFFVYLNDPLINNVQWQRNGNNFDFHIEQGSKRIEGSVNETRLEAHAYLASFTAPPVPVMRMLLGSNYQLKYSRFAIKDDKIGIFLNADVSNSSPTRLYHALKELATKADRQDDLLTDEFDTLTRINTEHLIPIPENESDTRYRYFQQWINDTLEKCRSYDSDTFSGGISFLLLNLIYKIDYLLLPEGSLLDQLERLNLMYWDKNDGRSFQEKNNHMLSAFRKIADKPAEQIRKSFYRTQATFGIVNPSSQKNIADFIDECLKNTSWYIQNKYFDIELAIYEYCIGYCFYNFGMYNIHYKLMDLQFQILNAGFYEEMGVPNPYIKDGVLNATEIENRIRHILAEEQKEFPNLQIAMVNIRYLSVYEFHYSLLNEIKFLNFNK